MTPAEILRYTWHLSKCPHCEGKITVYEAWVRQPDGTMPDAPEILPAPRCKSCWGRGFASLAQFARRDLGRNPRSVARYLSGKLPVPPLVLERCKALIEDRQSAMSAAAKLVIVAGTQKSGTCATSAHCADSAP